MTENTIPFATLIIIGNIAAVKAALDQTPDLLNVLGQNDTTALHYAASNSQPEIAQLLIDRGMDPNQLNSSGVSPLGLLMKLKPDDVETALALLEKGADPNLGDARNNPLHLATAVPEMARALLNHGANPNATNVYGETPLHCAIEHLNQGRLNRELILMLVESGADPAFQSAKKPESPVQFARRWDHLELATEMVALAAAVRAHRSVNDVTNGATPQVHRLPDSF